jgi:hypothetical protein
MKQVIELNEEGRVVNKNGRDEGGVCVQASWATVAESLVEAGWGRLNTRPDEYVKQLVIDDFGIKMVIGRRGEK